MANMVSKTVLAGLLGGWRLLGEMVLLFAIAMAGGAAMRRCGKRPAGTNSGGPRNRYREACQARVGRG